ncbi:MAG TPA: hypothetical protein VK694_06330 [Verrucomicrobiae bacterium]|nr:hypothetical protein [Verrucomicrobiae bacterium]
MTRKSKKTNKPLLSHHRHTAKVLPHHHTSWPFVVLLLLMVGVVLVQATYQARAADMAVTATAEGPVPTVPAVITDPQAGAAVTDMPIQVAGTCQAPYVVRLYRNQVFSGSAQCQTDNTFRILTDLFEGRNELEARIFNFADQEGPAPAKIIIMYDPPSDSPPSGTVDESSGEIQEPFLLTTDQFFKANQDKTRIDWTFGITGGTGPYVAEVDWGDGDKSTAKGLETNSFSVSHEYTKKSAARAYYKMQVTATDTSDHTAHLQVFAVLNYSVETGGGGGLSAGPISTIPPPAGMSQNVTYIWGAYTATSLMAISFWLGQHVIAAGIGGHTWPLKLRFPKFW